MKRILILLLALIMCLGCFAACTTEPTGEETTVDSETTAGDETQGPDAEAATLTDAVKYLRSIYKDSAKETPADYDVVGKVVIGDTEFSVTWATDNESITVKVSEKNAAFYTVDIPAKNDTAVDYKLTATITDAAGESESVSFDRALPVYDSSAIVDKPEEGVAYKFYMIHASLGQTLFATGETQDNANKYILSTTDPKAAPDFFVEADGEGFKFYTELNGVKTYVLAKTTTSEDGKVSKYIGYSAEAGTTWTYKSETNAWYTTIEGLEYVVGTYGTYNTFCISESSYMTPDTTGRTQFPGGLMKKDVAESMTPSEGPTIYNTPEEIVNAVYALDIGGILSGGHKYTLTGVITSIPSAWSDDYGNITVVIVVNGMDDKPIECFRLKGDGADKLAVGDTITVTGELLKYDNKSETGKVEFNAGCTLVGGATAPENSVTNPTADGVYKLYLVQVSTGKTLFANGETQDDKFLKGTTDPKAGLDFHAEAVEGGFKFYTEIGGAKKYLHAHTTTSEDGKVSKFLCYADSTDAVWSYKAETNAWYVTINGLEYVAGTYGSYDTFSISDSKYMTAENTGKTQFPLNLVEKAVAEGGDMGGDETPDTPDTPDTPETPDIPDDAETMVIYFPKDGKYVTGIEYEYTSSKGAKKMQLTLTENKAEALAFTVIRNDDGTIAFMAEGKYLMADGTNVELVAAAGENTLFVMEEADGGYYIRCNTANYQGKPQYLEVYSGYLTCYGMGSDPSIYVFALQDGAGANGKVQEFGSAPETPDTPDTPDTPETPDTPVTGNNVALSVDTLGLASQSYAAGTTTLNGVGFEYIQMGNYGDGLQMRDKDGKTSSIWNTTAITGGIARIELVYSDSKDVKYANPDAVVFTFGNAVGEATCTTKLSTTAGVKTYTITPDAGSYTYFKLEHDLGYTFYWKSITIVFTDGSTASIG